MKLIFFIPTKVAILQYSYSMKLNTTKDLKIQIQTYFFRDDEVKEPVKEPKKKKRKIETPVFFDEALNVNIDIPVELKYILCRDWDNIVNKKRLFRIPAKVCCWQSVLI